MNPESLKLRGELDAPATKRGYNERLFAEVAPCYDRITRVLSFGRDTAWKREMIGLLPDFNAPHCLDVACGTGDLSELLLKRYPNAEITGIDLTPSMLDLARARLGDSPIQFMQGDMCNLIKSDGSIDRLTGGYALRNAPDLKIFLQEVSRVMMPGGFVAFLDFSRPDENWRASIHLALLKIWCGFWSWIFHRDPHVYGYIAHSLARYPSRTDLHVLFETNGLQIRHAVTRFFGLVEIIVARKAK